MKLTIIQLGIMHLNDCVDLDQKSLNGLWTKSQWERELTDPNRICIGIIELETKKLLGLCSAWLVIEELHITFIAVHPLHQRRGLGKFLLTDLIKRSKSLQTNHIHLEVKENNEPAKAFYKSMGFKRVGNRTNFYKDGSDALILKKENNKKSKNQ
ncbi:ribosomal protein S18-alanine N-acetyltransferase [Prochlorococcus marinus]|uniref:ribosomal protein S18-alanine N-acetyltransferase n=1 Tax=Prochlorococcus marinus TaxID=1219 RepID=UPI0022B437E3|nr:ribosomal protein S18-alanine N-acetyltransferase [Prochlorococcus marinus]